MTLGVAGARLNRVSRGSGKQMNSMPRDSFALGCRERQGGNGTDWRALGRLASGQAAGLAIQGLSRSLQQARTDTIESGRVFVHAGRAVWKRVRNEGFTLQEVADKGGCQAVRTFLPKFLRARTTCLAVLCSRGG